MCPGLPVRRTRLRRDRAVLAHERPSGRLLLRHDEDDRPVHRTLSAAALHVGWPLAQRGAIVSSSPPPQVGRRGGCIELDATDGCATAGPAILSCATNSCRRFDMEFADNRAGDLHRRLTGGRLRRGEQSGPRLRSGGRTTRGTNRSPGSNGRDRLRRPRRRAGQSVPFTVVDGATAADVHVPLDPRRRRAAAAGNSLLVTFDLAPSGDGHLLRMTESGFREMGWEVRECSSTQYARARQRLGLLPAAGSPPYVATLPVGR